jgi:hypothetical protein
VWATLLCNYVLLVKQASFTLLICSYTCEWNNHHWMSNFWLYDDIVCRNFKRIRHQSVQSWASEVALEGCAQGTSDYMSKYTHIWHASFQKFKSGYYELFSYANRTVNCLLQIKFGAWKCKKIHHLYTVSQGYNSS